MGEKTNPDVEELIRYNREGCDHQTVPGALTRAQTAAAKEKHGAYVLSFYQLSWCQACRDNVLAENPPRPAPAEARS